MKKKLNNKGYMLVEIVLASVLAMGVAYFITDLTIKLKNKNDDLIVKTLVYTDQAIIYNEIAEDLYTDGGFHDCAYIDTYFKTDTSLNKFIRTGYSSLGSFSHIVSEYATLGAITCEEFESGKSLLITIPITVEQLPDESFNVTLNYTNPDI